MFAKRVTHQVHFGLVEEDVQGAAGRATSDQLHFDYIAIEREVKSTNGRFDIIYIYISTDSSQF
jgi:hypothetical protein